MQDMQVIFLLEKDRPDPPRFESKTSPASPESPASPLLHHPDGRLGSVVSAIEHFSSDNALLRLAEEVPELTRTRRATGRRGGDLLESLTQRIPRIGRALLVPFEARVQRGDGALDGGAFGKQLRPQFENRGE